LSNPVDFVLELISSKVVSVVDLLVLWLHLWLVTEEGSVFFMSPG